MFKFLLSAFIFNVFAQISVEGKSCNVNYTGLGGSDASDSYKKCDSTDIPCIFVNGTIQGKSFTISDCSNTAAIILTNYLQGQYGYKTETTFDCNSINHYYNFNDGAIEYSYKCFNSIHDFSSTTSSYQTSTESHESNASTLSCILSSLFLSIVYITFN